MVIDADIIKTEILRVLNESGKIFLETHEQLAEKTAALFNTEIYIAEIKKDLFEKQRMVIVSHRSR